MLVAFVKILLRVRLEYHRRALLHYKSTLGNRHHRTADLFVEVAEHNIRLRQSEMALALLDHALEAYSYSNNFMPEKSRAIFMRMNALRALRKTDEADAELSKCFTIYTRLFMKQGRTRKHVAKSSPEELVDEDLDDLIVFWSK